MTTTPPKAVDVARLRAATPADWPLIRRWLGQPEVIRWWGPRATTEAEVMLAMGTPQAICRIIEAPSVTPSAQGDWLAVGYAHALDAGLAGPPRLDVVPPGAWQIDAFIASLEHRGRGIGGIVLLLMLDEVFETTLALAAAAFVAVGNEKAVRVYEQAGFTWRAVARDKDRGAAWLMVAERSRHSATGQRSSGGGRGTPNGTPRLV